jgi:hypothetical protein
MQAWRTRHLWCLFQRTQTCWYGRWSRGWTWGQALAAVGVLGLLCPQAPTSGFLHLLKSRLLLGLQQGALWLQPAPCAYSVVQSFMVVWRQALFEAGVEILCPVVHSRKGWSKSSGAPLCCTAGIQAPAPTRPAHPGSVNLNLGVGAVRGGVRDVSAWVSRRADVQNDSNGFTALRAALAAAGHLPHAQTPGSGKGSKAATSKEGETSLTASWASLRIGGSWQCLYNAPP